MNDNTQMKQNKGNLLAIILTVVQLLVAVFSSALAIVNVIGYTTAIAVGVVVVLCSVFIMAMKKSVSEEKIVVVAVCGVVFQVVFICVGLALRFEETTKPLEVPSASNVTNHTFVAPSTGCAGVLQTTAPHETSTAPVITGFAAETLSVDIRLEAYIDGMMKLSAITQPKECSVRWSSSDDGIATVDASGAVYAVSEGSASIIASFTYDGLTCEDSVTVVVTNTREDRESGFIRYLSAIPTGMDTRHSDFLNLQFSYDIYGSKDDALGKAVRADSGELEIDNEHLIGYVYYHWCRGEDLDEFSDSHNRTSGMTQGKHQSTVYGNYADCNSFSCFFSDTFLSENEMTFSSDGSNCVWYENYSVCHDSYWYWTVPVYQCDYKVTQSNLTLEYIE